MSSTILVHFEGNEVDVEVESVGDRRVPMIIIDGRTEGPGEGR